MKNKMSVLASCPNKLRQVLVKELNSLGAEDVYEVHKGVRYSGSQKLFYKSHLYLRTASAIYRILKEFECKDLDDFYAKSRKLRWDKIFDPSYSFKVEVYCSEDDRKFNKTSVTKTCRQSIQDYFFTKYSKIPQVETTNPQINIVVYEYNHRFTVSVSSSGKSLHKRGYKDGFHPAPLKETLAAGLLLLAGYDGSQALVDGMCGSGTVPIEAAYISLNKAPLIHRKKGEFALELFKDFNSKLWRKVQEEARIQKASNLSANITANDIAEKFITNAQSNALSARVEKFIKFTHTDFLKLVPPDGIDTGLLFLNLPYGVRLENRSQAGFYQDVVKHLNSSWATWKWSILSSDPDFFKTLGHVRNSKKHDMFNGSIKVEFLVRHPELKTVDLMS